jgi:hypothetical protein
VARRLNTHMPGEHRARWWRYNEPSRRKKLRAWAWEHDGRKIAVAREEEEGDGRERKKTKGMGTTPTPGHPIYRGATESIRCGSLLRTTRPTALSREVREKIEVDFSLTDQVLRPKSEFRS